MTNLLQETREAIAASRHLEDSIIFIGSATSGHQCTWDEFCVLADVEYDAGFGAAEVATDLIIVFNDGQKLWRTDYDGAEKWNYSSPFVRPKKKRPITKLTGDFWATLSELNEVPKP